MIDFRPGLVPGRSLGCGCDRCGALQLALDLGDMVSGEAEFFGATLCLGRVKIVGGGEGAILEQGLKRGPVLDRAKRILADKGVSFSEVETKDRLSTLHIGGGPTSFMEFLGRVRSERLISKIQGVDSLTTRRRGNGKVRVNLVERIGNHPVQSIATTSKTYVGEGYLMHNSGDYEAQFKFIHENISWNEPDYDLYDPSQLREIARGLEDQGATFCILTDQVWDDKEPVLKYKAGRKVPHYCYANTPRSSFRHKSSKAQPFRYRPVDPARLTRDSKLEIAVADSAKLNFIKDVYLATSIIHSSGFGNYLVYLDGMLVGAIIYDESPTTRAAYGDRTIYLLPDVTVTAQGKMSKLVAMLATCRELVRPLELRMLKRYDRVVTTARTKHPVSMKYRGIYKKLSRREDEAEGGYVIQYGADLTEQTPQDIYRIWWGKYGPGRG